MDESRPPRVRFKPLRVAATVKALEGLRPLLQPQTVKDLLDQLQLIAPCDMLQSQFQELYRDAGVEWSYESAPTPDPRGPYPFDDTPGHFWHRPGLGFQTVRRENAACVAAREVLDAARVWGCEWVDDAEDAVDWRCGHSGLRLTLP